MYDAIVIGSGPAGYTAAIYCIRAGLLTLVLEGIEYGGQLMNTVDIENYPGFIDPVNGAELMMNMRSQCLRLGCKLTSQKVIGVKFGVDSNSSEVLSILNSSIRREEVVDTTNGQVHIVTTEDESYLGKVIIIATGATAKKLDILNGEKFWNHGISACAVCDGALPMFRNKPLIVVGGGDTACEEAIFLSKFGSKIYILVRSDKMRASYRMCSKVELNPKIEILYNVEIIEAIGNLGEIPHLTSVKITNNKTCEINTIQTSGLFYAIGHTPNTGFLDGKLEIDEAGYLITKNTITSIPGVFACGDVQDKVYRQAITAAGSGCIAALEAERYLNEN